MAYDKTEAAGPERLRVYQLALELDDTVQDILRITRCSRSLAGQLQRAVESIQLNIAEGAGHFSPGRKMYHYQTAHGSSSEVIAALTMLQRRRPSPHIHAARRNANMICIMLRGLIRAQERRRDGDA